MITDYDKMVYCGETDDGKLFCEETTVGEFRKLFNNKLRKECKVVFSFIDTSRRDGKKDTFIWSKNARGWLNAGKN